MQSFLPDLKRAFPETISTEPHILISNIFKIIMVRFFDFNLTNSLFYLLRGKKEIIMKRWSELYFRLKFPYTSCIWHSSHIILLMLCYSKALVKRH